jgi:hypothetical protein
MDSILNTTYSTSCDKPITINSMISSIKELEMEMKLNKMKESGINDIKLYFRKYQKLPDWLKEVAAKYNLKIKRSTFINKNQVILLDGDMNNKFYLNSDLLTPITRGTGGKV